MKMVLRVSKLMMTIETAMAVSNGKTTTTDNMAERRKVHQSAEKLQSLSARIVLDYSWLCED